MKRNRLTLLRSFVLALAVATVAVYAISHGAEPTATATIAILVVALFGGIDAREVVALRHAVFGARDRGSDHDE
jgi:hypothetical protein